MSVKRSVKVLAAGMALCLSACAAKPVPTQTMEEFLAETNQKHAAVVREEIDPAIYSRNPERAKHDGSYFSNDADPALFDPALVLTADQIQEDIDYLFTMLPAAYTLYDYFGGDEAFGAAKNAILSEWNGQPMTSGELEQLLLRHLGFVEDGHFLMNRKSPAKGYYPVFYREVPFLKTEKGYCTTDGKLATSADGYENLDDLFRPSVSPEGELVYYPVVLMERVDPSQNLNSVSFPSEPLTIHYKSGSKQTLTALPYEFHSKAYNAETDESLTSHETDGIPVIKLTAFDPDLSLLELNGVFDPYKDAPAIIFDMRNNTGGYLRSVDLVLQKLAGQTVPLNTQAIEPWKGIALSALPDQVIPNDRPIVILADRNSRSAAEHALERSYNIENTFIVGENSRGCFKADAGFHQLPNSKCFLVFSEFTVFHTPDSLPLKELRGFLPDLWVPSDQAEEAAVALIKNLTNNQKE